jgi:regulator of protease activity HflC (stomatin/prohibitin superfamily)
MLISLFLLLLFRYVEDIVRSTVPRMELDSAFEAKEELAHAIRDSLQQTMGTYG